MSEKKIIRKWHPNIGMYYKSPEIEKELISEFVDKLDKILTKESYDSNEYETDIIELKEEYEKELK